MGDAPIFEVTLRKYEPPSADFDRNLRVFLLSLGLIRPGDQKSPLEAIFRELLVRKAPVSVEELAKTTQITESAVRYHLERLKTLRLVDGRKEYFVAENDISVAFRVFRKYVLEEILDRIENYVSFFVR
jgi:DNA-binding transcriptional ArsR family regulator